jgi:TRAP-type C4-dicarboxylate transport system substrate-binding protein
MKNLKRMLALLLALLMVMAFAACGGSEESAAPESTAPEGNESAAPEGDDFAEEPTYTLRFGHTLTEQDPFHQAYLNWADAVYEQTKGDVLIEVYANSQLGVEEDVLEQIRQGSNVGWQTDFARAGSYIREMGVMNCPYFLSSAEEVAALIDSPTMNGWLDQLASEYGLRGLSFSFIQGFRNVYCNSPVYSPADFSGLRIRTANAEAWLESINSLGCVATALNYGDIYTGIETSVVEGCELPYTAAFSLNIQEVCDYIIETQHIYQAQLLVVSEDWWNTVPEEYQTIIVDTLNEEGFKVTEQLEQNDMEYQSL